MTGSKQRRSSLQSSQGSFEPEEEFVDYNKDSELTDFDDPNGLPDSKVCVWVFVCLE